MRAMQASFPPTLAVAVQKPTVHKSAVCIIPPRDSWAGLQNLRCFNDKSFLRWMPHINLLYPFWEDSGSSFEDAASRIHSALAQVKPFQVSLSDFGHFEHRNYCTIWLGADEPKAVQELQGALEAEFPECADPSGRDFVPHLSVANIGVTADLVGERKQALRSKWAPLSFELSEVFIISRSGHDDPFVSRFSIPLGGHGHPRKVDIPYVATVGGPPSCAADQPLSASGGLDAAGMELCRVDSPAGGVWNFAYGANINKAKLMESRSLTPLESLPARLRGYRLSFRHRGGFGTVERAEPGDDCQEVHGVLHRLALSDYCKLCAMEHEYRPMEVQAEPYCGGRPVMAVAFVTPPGRLIRPGLLPTSQYLGLLQEGAEQWGLEPRYRAWLEGLEGLEGAGRGDAYYESPEGARLEPWPKIYTGSQQGGSRGKQRRFKGGRRGRGGGPGDPRARGGGSQDDRP